MDKIDKIRFVNELAANVASSLVEKIEKGNIPEDWDGHELRQLFADKVAWRPMDRKRMKEFRNTVLVNNL